MEGRFRVLDDTLRMPCGGGDALVYAPLTRRAEKLSEREIGALSACAAFAPLEQHAARLDGVGSMPLLRSLAERGLLVSEARLVAELRARARRERWRPPIAFVGIPTRGRVEQALAAVTSCALARAHDSPLEIVLGHDAVGPDEQERLLAGLAALAVPDAVTLRYAGPDERRRYAAALAECAGVDAELVAWALVRGHPAEWSEGTCRNALVLDSVGQLALQIDDDIASETAPSPLAEPGLALSSTGATAQLWFPAAGESAESLVELAPTDLPALHVALLGRPIAACLADAGPLDLGEASGRLLRAALAGEGRVRVTQMGIVGDCASGSLGHYFTLQGPSRQRLVFDEAIFHHAFASRQALRAGRRAAITDAAACMGFVLGLDNREILPPFIPSGRNADGLFGVTARLCFRDTFLGVLSEVVAHRARGRHYSLDQLLREVEQIDCNDLLCRLVNFSGVQSHEPEPAHALDALGGYLQSLAELPLAELEELVWVTVLRTRSHDIASLRGTLGLFRRQPPFWAEPAERALDALRRLAVDKRHSYPRDLVAIHGEKAGRRALARVLRDYGRLLCAWPELHRAARELRAAGVRPSRPIR